MYSQTWLESPSSIRIVLIVATAYIVTSGQDMITGQTLTAGQEKDFYFSTTGYVTTDGIIFNPVVAGTVGFQESISEEGSVSMSFGDIELHNLNGELDSFLDSTKYIWSNRPIKIYWGDPGWKYSLSAINSTNYLTIFDGVIDDIDSRSNRTVNFRVRDKLERLNSPISENKLGTWGVWQANQQNTDTMRPLVLGEVFNITPLLIDPATLQYMFSSSYPLQSTGIANNGSSELLIEIRDNGVPIYRYDSETLTGAIVDLSTSTFKLTKTPAGTITCSVQGMKKTITLSGAGTGVLDNARYTNSIPNTIAVITTQFGKDSTKLSISELDLTTFAAFDQTAEIGLLVDGSQNVLTVCQELAGSLGGQLIMSRTGLLRLIQFGVPLSNISTISITVNDILYDTLSISRRLGVKAATKLAYAKNYTVQQNLLTDIPSQHKSSFETEWLTVIIANSSIKNNYKLDEIPGEKQTALISYSDAYQECQRLTNYFDEQRVVYSFTGGPKLLSLVLGQGVTITHPRFGLNSGKSGQVIRLAPNWTKQEVEVEVIV